MPFEEHGARDWSSLLWAIDLWHVTNPSQKVEAVSRAPISGVEGRGKATYLVLQLQKDMHEMHGSYAIEPYPNRFDWAIRTLTSENARPITKDGS